MLNNLIRKSRGTVSLITKALAHLSGEVGATWHPHGDVHVVAVAVELSGGEGVAQVAVVVLRVALLRLPLVAQVPQVQRERLTCNLRRLADSISSKTYYFIIL